MNKYRLFIIGAGFSRLAGLPLANELWEEVLTRAKFLDWFADDLNYELSQFKRFRASRGDDLTIPIDFEDFISYLDIEHALGLKGSDTFSEEGNELQLVLKWLIAQVIVEKTPESKILPKCYLDFAETLQPSDYILTFNYDTILENTLDQIGKPYRLFPTRFLEVGETDGIVDSTHDEIVIIKLHGSVDWFDRSWYDELIEVRKSAGLSPQSSPPSNIVFNPSSPVTTVPLLEGPQFPDDPLISVYRVKDGLEYIYNRQPNILVSPLMLSPSYAKVLYADRLRSFFWGLGKTGGLNKGVIVIGYSIPQHDNFARQILLHIFSNYQQLYWEEEYAGSIKKPVLLIDYRPDSVSEAYYRLSYSFSDTNKTNYYLKGFSNEAVKKIRMLT